MNYIKENWYPLVVIICFIASLIIFCDPYN
jgi:hypothetical protein